MRFVGTPVQQPHRCAFLGLMTGSSSRRGFVEGDLLAGGDRAYISVEAVEQIAARLGMAPKAIHAGMAQTVAGLEGELERSRARIAELERTLAAVGTLKAAGFESKRGPGRPSKKVPA